MIIDVHSHLGDILYPNGKEQIYKKNVVMEKVYDPQGNNEKLLMRSLGLGKYLYLLLKKQATRAQRARNLTATLENMQKSLDEAGVNFTVCLPIAPNITFEDLAEAATFDSRIIPFTSVDFTGKHDIGKKLASDVKQGARGLKLHPIIQRVPLTDKRTFEAVQVFVPFNKPVLMHAGKAFYYMEDESDKQSPENGEIKDVEALVRSFPKVNFIIGHSGIFWHRQVCKRLRGCTNIWVDTSFQSPGTIRNLVKTFGPEKVMYASDWPWGSRPPHVKTVKAACRGDRVLEDMIYYKNAAGLLGINM